MTRDELAAWLRLTGTKGIGRDAAQRLLTAFGLPQHVLAQSVSALSTVVSTNQATALHAVDAAIEQQIETTWHWLQQASDTPRAILTLGDKNYPKALLNMPDAPVLLYAMGQVTKLQSTHQYIAMVGSRNPTPQGVANAQSFAKTFADMGCCVVSGLALGIDAAAHHGALEAAAHHTSLSTIAVVGTGLDRVYPRQNRDLAHQISQHGVILSEYPLGAKPLAHHFPQRNRIIAGLSQGVLVVEAALQSGSLITARLASEYGREVFAIPGSIHAPQARGCHSLIKQGAKLVEAANDVLEELQYNTTTTDDATAPSDYSAHHTVVLEALGYDPMGIDALLARTGYDTAQLQAQLLELELQGAVARLPGGLFQRVVVA